MKGRLFYLGARARPVTSQSTLSFAMDLVAHMEVADGKAYPSPYLLPLNAPPYRRLYTHRNRKLKLVSLSYVRRKTELKLINRILGKGKIISFSTVPEEEEGSTPKAPFMISG